GAALLRLLSGSHASLLLGRLEEHMADFAATHASRRAPQRPSREARFEGGGLETQVSVSALFVYPVKSARGIARPRVRVTASAFDRISCCAASPPGPRTASIPSSWGRSLCGW